MSNLNLLHKLVDSKQVDCPRWLPDNLMYLTLMGSRAYGCETVDSDYDYYGFAMLPKDHLFPNHYGMILGFDKIPVFEQWQKQHFIEQDSSKDMEITVYGIVRYFKLLYDGNPNIIESLFTTRECVVYSTPISERIRENRHLFLSKQNFYKTRSYAFSQLHKMKRLPEGNRLEDYNTHGYSTKFAGHCIRLIDDCEQILTGDLDLRRNREMIKSIRKGEWKLEAILDYANQKEISLEKSANESTLPEKPNISKIRNLLLSCLETHYGSLDKVVIMPDRYKAALNDIQTILNGVK